MKSALNPLELVGSSWLGLTRIENSLPRIENGLARSSRFLLLTMTILSATGCSGLNKNPKPDFLKPIASTTNAKGSFLQGPMPSERKLCLETAKTVADQGHAQEAVKLYERAEQLDPNAPPLDAELAPLYAHAGNLEASIDRYERCTQMAPDDTNLSNNFAWTLMEAGRLDRALTQAENGLENDPANVRLRSTLAMIHYRIGDRVKALQDFEQAYGLAAAHHNLAILDIDAGDLDSAKAHLQVAKQSPQADSKTEMLATALESKALLR